MVKIMSKSEFARLAGVSAAAVTKACVGALQPARIGKRLDAGHPAAAHYLKIHASAPTPESEIGLDPEYWSAVDYCVSVGKYSTSGIQRHFKIGYNRAKSITDEMRRTGLIAGTSDVPSPRKPPHVRGHVAKREKDQEFPVDEEGLPENILQFADLTLREIIARFGTSTRVKDWLDATRIIEMIHEKRIKNAALLGTLVSRKLIHSAVIDEFNAAHLNMMQDGAKTLAEAARSKVLAGIDIGALEVYISDVLGSFVKPVKARIARNLKHV